MLTKLLLNDWAFAGLCILGYTIFTGAVLYSAFKWDQRDRKKGRL